MQVVALLKHFAFFAIDALSQFFEGIHHVLFGHLGLLSHIPLFLVQSLLLDLQFVTLNSDLALQLLDGLYDLWVGFPQKGNVVTLVVSVDDTLTADRVGFALEAEVGHFLFRMICAQISYLPIRLVHLWLAARPIKILLLLGWVLPSHSLV